VRSRSGGGVGAGWAFLRRAGHRGWRGRVWGGSFEVVMDVCITLYIHSMNQHSPAQQKWQRQIASLWPAAKGSLAKVYKPCIRENCLACARGDKHPAWLLSLSSQGRRKTMYVPQAMVPSIKKAIRNGRRIERLLFYAGPELLREYRKTRNS
jgi:hypothetical protein